MEQLLQAVLRFSFIPVLVVSVYVLLIYGKLVKELKPFAWFIFLSGAIESGAAILWFNGKNNMPLLHIYVAGGFTFLCLFYRGVLEGFIEKKIIYGVLFGFLGFTLVNSMFVQKPFTFNSYALTVEATLVIIFSLVTYMVMMDDIVRKTRLPLAKTVHWINSGLFLYYSSSILIFYFGDFLTSLFYSAVVNAAWVVHAFFSFVMYAFFFVAFLRRPAK